MKTYKLSLVTGDPSVIRIEYKLQRSVEEYWQFVGIFDHLLAARYILLAMTNDVQITFAKESRFEEHFLGPKNSFPRLITERDVFGWIGSQVAAGI